MSNDIIHFDVFELHKYTHDTQLLILLTYLLFLWYFQINYFWQKYVPWLSSLTVLWGLVRGMVPQKTPPWQEWKQSQSSIVDIISFATSYSGSHDLANGYSHPYQEY